jgi:hypothetical protein
MVAPDPLQKGLGDLGNSLLVLEAYRHAWIVPKSWRELGHPLLVSQAYLASILRKVDLLLGWY